MRADPDEDTRTSLEYLQAQLARLDVAIRRELWRWQLAGQDPRDAYRGLYLSDGDAHSLARQAPFLNWGQAAEPDPAGLAAFENEEKQAREQVERLAQKAAEKGIRLHIEEIRTRFALDLLELDLLLLCLAPEFDLRYQRLYGFLQDDITRKQPSINLALDLLAQPGPQRLLLLPYFDSDAPLFRYGILERIGETNEAHNAAIGQSLRVSETITAWVFGRYQPAAVCAPAFSLLAQPDTQTDRLLGQNILPFLDFAAFVQADPPVFALFGPDTASQQAAGHLIAARQAKPLLWVDLAAVCAAGFAPDRAVWMALRDARLVGAVPFLTGWESCLPAEGPSIPATEVMQAMAYLPDLTIVSSLKRWRLEGLSSRRLIPVEFPIPDTRQRAHLWSHFLGQEGEQIQLLAGQFKLTSSQVRDAVRGAQDQAFLRGTGLETADLYAAAQAQSNSNLSTLARKIVPRHNRADIILPLDQMTQLGEIIDTVRLRPRVMEEWGVGRKLASGQGVTILFAGPPGTGKTMAAGIIAAELGLELYKIDLSGVISKYIGETEKNLEKIFQEASSSNAILFFDEADAIFGKRSEVRDAHDRYANIEISYLLQRMEAYDGVTILATNLRANLDEAFTRRLQFAVDFPFPEEADRLRIWQTLFPAELPRAPDLDFARLAQRYKLAGGSIRNILQGAAYLAAADGGVVTMEHLMHSARREFQKMGRLPVEIDLGKKE